MIIFSLEALADDSHRRHFIDPKSSYNLQRAFEEGDALWPEYKKNWKPDYEAYNAACGEDKPVEAVILQWNHEIGHGFMGEHKIWTTQPESMRDKVEQWLYYNLICFLSHQLVMRPDGDTTPAHELKERWLLEEMENATVIEYVFESDPESVKMFRDHGVFVFGCGQGE